MPSAHRRRIQAFNHPLTRSDLLATTILIVSSTVLYLRSRQAVHPRMTEVHSNIHSNMTADEGCQTEHRMQLLTNSRQPPKPTNPAGQPAHSHVHLTQPDVGQAVKGLCPADVIDKDDALCAPVVGCSACRSRQGAWCEREWGRQAGCDPGQLNEGAGAAGGAVAQSGHIHWQRSRPPSLASADPAACSAAAPPQSARVLTAGEGAERSWPAVSQMVSLTRFPPSSTTLALKSTPAGSCAGKERKKTG